MDPILEHQRHITRREFFGRTATGIGTAALASLLSRDGLAEVPARPHFPAKAKRIIYLFMNGAPTHVDLFDYKPKLQAMHGTPIPDEYIGGKRFSTMTGKANGKLVLGPIEPFKQRGQSGAWVSDFLPYTASIADELCFVKSMRTEAINHAPGISFVLSGSEMPGRPTIGAWLNYGLGSENDNLPSFVVMTSVSKGTTCGQIFYDFYWGSGFLPSRFQGVKFRGSGDPVLYLSNPEGMSREVRRGLLDDIAKLNEIKLRDFGDPEIATRISQYEMAYRMQVSAPEVMNINDEPQYIHEMYGTKPGEACLANNILLARKLVEKGVRFVQIFDWGWDSHGTDANLAIDVGFINKCRQVDKCATALILDLKQRGLLEETLVIWGGEFGRTPMMENR